MTQDQILQILRDHKTGILSDNDALGRLKNLPFEDLGFANVDHHRSLRQGFPEVVFGAGKSPEQVGRIVESMSKNQHNVLITRATERQYARVKELAPEAEFHETARAITICKSDVVQGKGTVMVISAGTSDMPVAEEALVTLKLMGNLVDPLYDVGVAGLHRLLDRRGRLTEARVLIVVAGMEGALPSVVAGLVPAPVIAVPTSVGYGASFGGVAALLGMLNSCASNVAVVNIDNGYGAAMVASLINRV
ncbi:MAG: nickel pincer cofactor biosynthesis protein LarB [Acidobacteria bacterium]|nr:MAG: nickel pincer cofactor biosynthesis protein LarB [Acidobacteriota bacterium]